MPEQTIQELLNQLKALDIIKSIRDKKFDRVSGLDRSPKDVSINLKVQAVAHQLQSELEKFIKKINTARSVSEVSAAIDGFYDVNGTFSKAYALCQQKDGTIDQPNPNFSASKLALEKVIHQINGHIRKSCEITGLEKPELEVKEKVNKQGYKKL